MVDLPHQEADQHQQLIDPNQTVLQDQLYDQAEVLHLPRVEVLAAEVGPPHHLETGIKFRFGE